MGDFMNRQHFIWILSAVFVFLLPFQVIAEPNSEAIDVLLREAYNSYIDGRNDEAAAKLERALRIDPRNPILWHDLAGVRLKQQDWSRAANLAAKSNSFAVQAENKWLRVRNWVLIALACEGMSDKNCAIEARNRATALASP